MGRLLAFMAVFVLIGTPMVAFLWETLNQMLAGHFETWRLAIAVPLLFIFLYFLRVLARAVGRLERERQENQEQVR